MEIRVLDITPEQIDRIKTAIQVVLQQHKEQDVVEDLVFFTNNEVDYEPLVKTAYLEKMSSVLILRYSLPTPQPDMPKSHYKKHKT